MCLTLAPYERQYNLLEPACTAVSLLRLTSVCTAAGGQNHCGIDLQIPELGDICSGPAHQNNRKHIQGHTLEQVVKPIPVNLLVHYGFSVVPCHHIQVCSERSSPLARDEGEVFVGS